MSRFHDYYGNEIDIASERYITDTEPVFEFTDKGLDNRGQMVDVQGYGVTPLLPLDVPTHGTAQYNIVFFAKNSGTTSANNKLHIYDSGVYRDYWSVSENSEQTKNINDGKNPIDGIRFALPMADADYSYAYIKENGQILFAGKNTALYGKTNAFGLNKFSSLSASYISCLKQSWSALISETDGNYNRIPFLAYTDQHGTWTNVLTVLNAVDYFCDWSKLSKVFQLGDASSNGSTGTLAAALAVSNFVPYGKQINVIGNHDMQQLNPLADHTPIMKYFPCVSGARQYNRNEWWTIIDELRNVKYIVVNNFEMPAGENYQYWYQSAEQVEWFAKELEKADGYDVILLSHSYFDDGGTAYKRDGTTKNRNPSIWPWSKDTTANTAFHSLLAARKNKTSGTYTDSDGNSISYDFTNCDSELLMALHGHDHIESYEHLTNSITDYVFECFYDNEGAMNTIYFGYIDRVAKKFKNWKLYDGITAVDVQEIDIN